MHLFDKNIIKAVSHICAENSVKRLGLKRSNITFDRYEALKNMLCNIELVGTDGIIESLRYIKDEPDQAIREFIKKYEKFYYPGIGHGVGMNLHEDPFLGNYGTKVIEKGCIITMEPGLYIPGFGGVRI